MTKGKNVLTYFLGIKSFRDNIERGEPMKKFGLAFLIGFLLLTPYGLSKDINFKENSSTHLSTAGYVEAQQRVHRLGNVYFCATNWGFLGSQSRDIYESTGGCFSPNPDHEVQAPSFETPPNSGLEYLFQGALWIGAIVESETKVETLVTVGADGWRWMYELAPPDGAEGYIIERSTRAEVPCYSQDAVSEQDVVAIISDRGGAPITQEDIDTDWDGRWHRALGIDITQESYSWSEEGYDDFIIMHYNIKNVGENYLSELYLGFYMDTDISHINESYNPGPEEGCHDDITGFLKNYVDPYGETTQVNIAWAADNDGQPYEGAFTDSSPTGVIGLRLLDCSNPDPEISYNWWTLDWTSHAWDWGPWLKVNQEKWEQINPYGSGIYFPDSVMGIPGGDRSKYFLLSNGEIDFDQIFTDTLPKVDTSWIPADNKWSQNFADGIDVIFVYSFGPFDLAPGDTFFAVIALIAGENFHTDPLNRAENLPDHPYDYYENLDFSDLVYNAQKAMEAYQGFVDVGVEEVIEPADFCLNQNYPNPFNSATSIPFTIPSPPVNSSQFMVHSPPTTTLRIYNILGQKVRTLVDEKKLPGEYRVNWDGKDEKGNEVGSGIYLYKLKAGDHQQVKKMVLLK